ncbi:coiled-coil alpha-helical rod protein 1-like [Myiozetetes cayanensis]|uniref:coiled-coil alpha-helical rod protein 1-like n=1 Tax=Myiozetetes cayanensis TaxID=478635 RepID=UPI002161011A|nr:coiled-coil alpha-helical rod protein 1-like [Myiozetetes cayanensis]
MGDGGYWDFLEKGALQAELEAERRRGQALEAELEAERRRVQALGAELEALRGRVHALEAVLAEKGRGQVPGEGLEAKDGHGQDKGAEPPSEELQLRARLSALGHLLTLQDPQAPPPAQVSGWRRKVFELLVQVRTQEGTERHLRDQVAARSRQVTRLERRLREEGQEVTWQRLRAEAAEAALGELGQALDRSVSPLCHLQGCPQPPPEATPGGDTKMPPPGRVGVALLLSHLQAVGSALLGDTPPVGSSLAQFVPMTSSETQ